MPVHAEPAAHPFLPAAVCASFFQACRCPLQLLQRTITHISYISPFAPCAYSCTRSFVHGPPPQPALYYSSKQASQCCQPACLPSPPSHTPHAAQQWTGWVEHGAWDSARMEQCEGTLSSLMTLSQAVSLPTSPHHTTPLHHTSHSLTPLHHTSHSLTPLCHTSHCRVLFLA